jgi:hypothetical protein
MACEITTSTKEIFSRQNPLFKCPDPPVLLDGFAVKGLPEIALVDGSRVFLSQHHPPSFSMVMYQLGDEQ